MNNKNGNAVQIKTQDSPAAEGKIKPPVKRYVTVLAVVASVLVALGALLLIWYLGDRYPDFENRFRQESEIPGLDDGVTPQGACSYGGNTFVSGYFSDGTPSRIYMTDADGNTGYVTVKLEDGASYTGHASGIATNGSKFWLVSESTVYVLAYTDVISNADEEGGEVEVTTSWNANCNASFCYYRNNYFYVGEFYRPGNYETEQSHRLTTPEGDKNCALILRYSATLTNPTVPSRAFSITDEIQGMAINSDGTRIVLSQSYAVKNSHLLVYSFSSTDTEYGTIKLAIGGEEQSVRVYYLDSANLVADYEIPAMSEGLYSDGDRIYVLFESAGKKYRLFVRERLNHIYSFRLRI